MGSLPSAALVAAKTIQAGRLKFPPPPAFNPLPFYDKSTADMYNNPFEFGQQPDVALRPPPSVRILASAQEKLALYKILASTNRLQPVRPDSSRKPYAAGLFSVIKDLERDRLIILDARPGNVLQTPRDFWTGSLGTAEAVCDIILQPWESLRISSADLKDYFYQFQISEQRLARNLLTGCLSLHEASLVFDRNMAPWADHRGRVYVGLNTLAMGDCSACEFAQGAHLGLLARSGVVAPHELLALHRPPPRGLLSIGVVIDDLVILERVLRGIFASHTPHYVSEGRKRLDKAYAAYAGSGLLANREKGCEDETVASFWGITLDGEAGIVRPNLSTLAPLMVVTARIVSLGLVTKPLLESVIGSWVSILLLRRRSLALLDLCYAAACSSSAHAVIKCDELLSLLCIAPALAADLRAPCAHWAYASDASTSHLAIVRAPLHESIAQEAFRHSLRKGAWVQLLSPNHAWLREHELLDPSQELPEGHKFTPSPVWRALMTTVKFEVMWSRLVDRRAHINVHELSAYLRLEALLAKQSCGSRFVHALDSQVALGALCKGRSPSCALSRLLRSSLAHYLGSGLYPGLGYVETSENPADDPTQGRPVRDP